MLLTRISVSHPVFATMIMLALLVFGIYSYQRLPIESIPNIDIPVVAVVVGYPGASPEAVESDIIEPVEDAVNTINGIDTIQSIAQSGRAMIILMFDMDVPSTTAVQDVRDRMATLAGSFPDNAADAQILRFDPNQMPILSMAISSDTMSARDLTALTEDVIVPRLSAISGVGSATVVGGIDRQIHIRIDPDRLTAFNIGVGAVASAITNENVNIPTGSIEDGLLEQSIQVEGRLGRVEEFRDIIVGRLGGQPVRLGDVATIEAGESDVKSIALLNGERALAVNVVKAQGANTVGVVHDIRKAISKLESSELPEGVHIKVVRDNAVEVEQSFHAVQNMLVEGALLAVFIVFIFLNSWRSTVITGLTLPISIIGAMIALYFFGFTLNMMTLMALSLAVGLLIDDAIVVRENIMRHLHMGKNHRQAALDGTNEIGLAVLATTLSIVAVFLPVAFMDGILGRFFLQFGVTVSVAVLISLFVAFTLDPMLSSVWYDPDADPDRKHGPIGWTVQRFDIFFDHVRSGYKHVLRWALKHRKTTLMIALAAFVGSFLLVPMVGAEFAPAVDNSELQVDVETPLGSSLDYTAAKLQQVDIVLKRFPEVESTYATIASSYSTSGSNEATLVATLVPPEERDRAPLEMTSAVRDALAQIPGIKINVGAAGGFGGVSSPIQVKLYGDNFATLDRLANQLMSKMRKINGVVDIESSYDAAQPVLGVRVNREAASDLGVSLAQIGAALSPMLGGKEVTDWTAPDGKNYTVIVRLPESARNDIEALKALPIAQSGATGSASLVRLDQVAEIVHSETPAQINRLDLSRQVTVTANLDGVELGSVTTPLQGAIDSLNLPAGYRVSMGGDAEDLADAASSAGSALLLAVIFIYLVLASQFGSFLQPVAIMFALPLALIGVLLGLMVGHSTLNIYSMIGFIMLMGLVVKNAILLVDNANQHVAAGDDLFDALVTAGGTRFRPIIMTTLAMICGMLPLALRLHEGSGENAPMAHAVIGGLLSSTVLTLVVVPVALTYIESFGRFVRRFLPKAPDHTGHQPAD